MNFTKTCLVFFGLICLNFFSINYIEAASLSRPRWNLDNWFTRVHPKISSFSMDIDGNFSGKLADGAIFYQYSVYNSSSTRIQKFEQEDYYHYIVDGEIIYDQTLIFEYLRSTTTTTL